MNTQSSASTAVSSLHRQQDSWFDRLACPTAPLIATACALVCADTGQAAGANTAEVASNIIVRDSSNNYEDSVRRVPSGPLFVGHSGRLGRISIGFTSTNCAGQREIRSGSVTFINETTAITDAHLFGEGVLLKDPTITISTGGDFNAARAVRHNVAVPAITIFSGCSDCKPRVPTAGVAILKLDAPVADCTPIQIAAGRPAVRSFVFIADDSRLQTSSRAGVPFDWHSLWRRSVVTGAARFGEQPDLYFNASFNRDPHRDVGGSASRGFGGAVFNQEGEVVGLASAATDYSFEVSITVFDLTNPTVRAKIMEIAGSKLRVSTSRTPSSHVPVRSQAAAAARENR
jgi:hypothetical protein